MAQIGNKKTRLRLWSAGARSGRPTFTTWCLLKKKYYPSLHFSASVLSSSFPHYHRYYPNKSVVFRHKNRQQTTSQNYILIMTLRSPWYLFLAWLWLGYFFLDGCPPYHHHTPSTSFSLLIIITTIIISAHPVTMIMMRSDTAQWKNIPVQCDVRALVRKGNRQTYEQIERSALGVQWAEKSLKKEWAGEWIGVKLMV